MFHATDKSGGAAGFCRLFLADRVRNRADLLAERGIEILEWTYEGTLLITHGGE